MPSPAANSLSSRISLAAEVAYSCLEREVPSPAANCSSARVSNGQRRIEMLREREVPGLRYSDGAGALTRLVNRCFE